MLIGFVASMAPLRKEVCFVPMSGPWLLPLSPSLLVVSHLSSTASSPGRLNPLGMSHTRPFLDRSQIGGPVAWQPRYAARKSECEDGG